jgi:hypothetical protein
MSWTEQYRQFAEECLRWAVNAETEKDRQALLGLAKTWNQAAIEAERSQQPTNRSQNEASAA